MLHCLQRNFLLARITSNRLVTLPHSQTHLFSHSDKVFPSVVTWNEEFDNCRETTECYTYLTFYIFNLLLYCKFLLYCMDSCGSYTDDSKHELEHGVYWSQCWIDSTETFMRDITASNRKKNYTKIYKKAESLVRSTHCQPLSVLTGSWPATLWAAGWNGPAAACRWAPAASRSWAASARWGPSSGCSHSSTPCCVASPCTGWRCSWLSMSVGRRDTALVK